MQLETIERLEPFESKLSFIFSLTKGVKKKCMKHINIYCLWELNLIGTFLTRDFDGKIKSFKKIRLKSILK